MRLNEIQARFSDMIMMQGNPDDSFARFFETGDIPLSARLAVYRNNVISGLTNAVAANFPMLEKLVGKDFLNSIIKSYARANPPVSGCLTFYGDDFDQFIASHDSAVRLPYLADMAKLEILINRSAHAGDDEALAAEDLTAIPPDALENMELKTRHSVHLLKSPWPLQKIREFCLNERDAPDINSGGACLLTHRPLLDTEVAEITDGEFAFLNALTAGMKLGEAVAHAMDISPAFDIQIALPRFVSMQLFMKPGQK